MPKPSVGPVCRLLTVWRLKWLSSDGLGAPACTGGLLLLPERPNVQKVAEDSRGDTAGDVLCGCPRSRSSPSRPCPGTELWPIRCVGTGLIPTPPVSTWRKDDTAPLLGDVGEVGDAKTFAARLSPPTSPAPYTDDRDSEYLETGDCMRPRSLSSSLPIRS